MAFSSGSTRRLLSLLPAVLFVLAGTTGPAYAQSGMRSVEAVSTGGGTSVLGTGPAQLYANPANLTAGDASHTIEIQLLRVGVYSGGDLIQFEHYTPLLVDNEEPLSNEREKAILDEWFGGGQLGLASYVEVAPFSVTYRPEGARWAIGGGVRGRVHQTSGVSQGVLDLVYRGTEADRTVSADMRTRVYGTVDVTGAFSYRLSGVPLSIGVAPRLILGTGYADGTWASQAEISGETVTLDFDYTARAAGPLSRGFFDTFNAFGTGSVDQVAGGSLGVEGVGGGIDFGGTYTPLPGLHVSMSVTDLGKVWWTGNAQTVKPENHTFEYDGITLDLDRLDNEFGGDLGAYAEHQVDSLAQAAFLDVKRERASFSTGLPTTVHLSSTWERSPFTVNGGASIGFNENAGAVPTPAAVHAGGEIDLGVVPIRAGVRLWGTQAATVSGGFGIHAGGYRFDLGASATPSTSALGEGARYAISFSLATIRM